MLEWTRTVAAVGNLVFASALLWRVLFVTVTPHYFTDLLPSMLLTGIGVGLTLPTLVSAAASIMAAAASVLVRRPPAAVSPPGQAARPASVRAASRD